MKTPHSAPLWPRIGLPGLAVLCSVALFSGGCGPLVEPTDDAGNSDPLHLSSSSAAVYSTVTADLVLEGQTVSAKTVEGTLGNVPITAVRIDENSLAIPVPEIAPGYYDLMLKDGPDRLHGNLEVVASTEVSNPDEYLRGVIAEIRKSVDLQEKFYFDPAAPRFRADTVQLRQNFAGIRSAVDKAERDLATASAADRAKVAAYIATNRAILGLNTPPSPGSGPSLASIPAKYHCGENYPDWADHPDERLKAWYDCVFKRIELVRDAALGLVAGSAVIGTVSWFFSPVGKVTATLATAAAAGAFLGLSAAMIDGFLTEELYVVPVPPSEPIEFVSSVWRPVEILGSYRSINSEDLKRQGYSTGQGEIGKALASLALVWAQVSAKIPFSTSLAPAIPEKPRHVELRPIPPSHLNLLHVPNVSQADKIENGQYQVMLRISSEIGSGVPVTLPFRVKPAFFGMNAITKIPAVVHQP